MIIRSGESKYPKNPMHILEIHKQYRKNYKNTINREDYSKIIQEINVKIIDEVINGMSFDVPYLGIKLYVLLTKARQGKVNFAGDKIANYIDCIATHKAHKEYPELKEQGVYITSSIQRVFTLKKKYNTSSPPALKFFRILKGVSFRDKLFQKTLEYNT